MKSTTLFVTTDSFSSSRCSRILSSSSRVLGAPGSRVTVSTSRFLDFPVSREAAPPGRPIPSTNRGRCAVSDTPGAEAPDTSGPRDIHPDSTDTTSRSGVTPAASYIACSSEAGLNAPSGPRFCVHSMCTAPGIAPPRAARMVVPQYSPSDLVSRMATSDRSSRSATSRQVASTSLRLIPVQEVAAGGVLSVDRGSPAAVHARTPPSSSRTLGCPNSSRNQNARAARIPESLS